MSRDDEVRGFVRKVGAGDGEAAVRLARELERAGRSDDLLPALSAAREHAEVRREIGRIWSTRKPSSFGCVDARPTRAPRVRWTVQLEGRDQLHSLEWTPLGVVGKTNKRVVVLDPDSGAVRHEYPAATTAAVARDVLLLVRPSRLMSAHDLWTGELLHETRIQGAADTAQVGGDLLLSGGSSAVFALSIAEPRRPPVSAWTRKGSFTFAKKGYMVTWAGPVTIVTRDSVALASPEGKPPLLDHAGATRFEIASSWGCWLADDNGLITRKDQDEVAYQDATGQVLWQTNYVNALGRTTVVRRLMEQGRAALHDRTSGKVVAEIPFADKFTKARFGVARDTYHALTRKPDVTVHPVHL